MPATIDYTETLTVTSCYCGIAVAIPDSLYRWMQQSSNNGCYCPSGHQFYFTETYEKKLKREQRAHESTRELLAFEERSHNATKGHLTRTKKRVAAGVCPCCHRTFKQLARHMENKHPEYAANGTS